MDKQSLPPSYLNDKSQLQPARFTVTYCHSCGFRQRAVKVAAEVEEALQEDTAISEGANGIFEIKDRGVVIFSKKDAGRFPDAGEIVAIAQALDAGVSIEEARSRFSAKAPSTESFEAWFLKAYGKPRNRFSID